MDEQSFVITPPPTKKFYKNKVIMIMAVVLLLIFIFAGQVRKLYVIPENFPVGSVITVGDGETLDSIGKRLGHEGVVRSAMLFKLMVIFSAGERSVKAGDYLLTTRMTTPQLVGKFTRGEYGFAVVKITVPEGLTTTQVADVFQAQLPKFDRTVFLEEAREKEGYLFPETYTFPENVSPKTIVKKMTDTFTEKTAPYEQKFLDFKKTTKEILTMGSILEEEAKTPESRRVVSGILWKRLALGMPLQVDAAFLYINGKNTYDLTTEDLKIDSPYNTYKYKGLPPGPISNPGLDSILSAVEPTKTNYLYYLSERNGTMHYAVTYAEHLRNKAKYIK